jgi:hypothetical protein
LRRTNSHIIAVLSNSEGTPTDLFWNAKSRIDEEAEKLINCLDGHSRSKMNSFLALMLQYGFIEQSDVTEFSEELQKRLRVSKG